jgi:bis(5'-nucleosidyl)-tetraphosphatase
MERGTSSAGIIPFHEGAYLLVLDRHSRTWGFPKGHLEEGETEEQTAHRELGEETGITADILEGFRERISYIMPDSRRKTVTYFLGEARKTTVRLQQEELDDHAWLPYDEAYGRISFPDLKELLRKAEDFRKKREETLRA